MKHRFWVKTLLYSILAFSHFSCKKEDGEAPPATIEDPIGVYTTLSWTMNNSSNSSENADLNIYLYKGVGLDTIRTAFYSENTSSSEEIFPFYSTLEDGDYTLVVDFVKVKQDGRMSILFNHMTIGASFSLESYELNNMSFTTAFQGSAREVVHIKKTGYKFIIARI